MDPSPSTFPLAEEDLAYRVFLDSLDYLTPADAGRIQAAYFFILEFCQGGIVFSVIQVAKQGGDQGRARVTGIKFSQATLGWQELFAGEVVPGKLQQGFRILARSCR